MPNIAVKVKSTTGYDGVHKSKYTMGAPAGLILNVTLDVPEFLLDCYYTGISTRWYADNVHGTDQYNYWGIYQGPWKGGATTTPPKPAVGWMSTAPLPAEDFLDLTKTFETRWSMGKGFADVYAEDSANPPTFSIDYQPLDFKITLTSDANIYPTRDNTFRWSVDGILPPGLYPKATVGQKSAVLEWRYTGAAETVKNTITGSTMEFVIPANTFTGTSIDWRVTVTSRADKVVVSDWKTIKTIDSTSVAKAVSPKNVIVKDEDGVEYKWTHTTASGTKPTGFDIEVSTDEGLTWKPLASQKNTDAVTYLAPQGDTPSGTVYWHVRTYNLNDKAGDWSDTAKFVCTSSAVVPVITSLTDTPRPTVTWTSTNQQAYRVIMGDHDTGMVYGNAQTYTAVNTYPDGELTVSVQYTNTSGQVSKTVTSTVIIKNIPQVDLRIEIADAHDGTTITWPLVEGFDTYYVIRDGMAIAKVEGNLYTDYNGIGPCKYSVRVVHDNGYYSTSAEVDSNSIPLYAYIGKPGEKPMLLKFNADTAPHTIGRSGGRAVEFVLYAGRKKPVEYVEEGATVQYTISHKVKEMEVARAVWALDGQTVVYKNFRGLRLLGLLSMSSSTLGFRTDLEFTITETDYAEAVIME